MLMMAAAMIASSVAARADMTGDTVNATYYYPNTSTVLQDLGNITAGTAGSDSGSYLGATFTVTGNQVTFTDMDVTATEPLPNSAFNGFVFTDLTTNPNISGITMVSGNITGIGTSFTSASLLFDFGDTSPQIGQTATFDITFGSPTSATPEPSAFVLLGTGLLGIAGAMRRRFV
jgi:hypothetical protein